jgi:hypothetical protein
LNENLNANYKNIGYEEAIDNFDKNFDRSARDFMTLVLIQAKNNVSEVILRFGKVEVELKLYLKI